MLVKTLEFGAEEEQLFVPVIEQGLHSRPIAQEVSLRVAGRYQAMANIPDETIDRGQSPGPEGVQDDFVSEWEWNGDRRLQPDLISRKL